MAESSKEPGVVDIENSQEEDTEAFDDVKVARDGINMLLNNQFEDAFKLFQAHK